MKRQRTFTEYVEYSEKIVERKARSLYNTRPKYLLMGKIESWHRRKELDALLIEVEDGKKTVSEVYSWCRDAGLDISEANLSYYKNRLTSVSNRLALKLAEKAEKNAIKQVNIRQNLADIIDKLKTVIDNSNIEKMKAENPREVANLATALGQIAKTLDEMERKETVTENSIIYKVVTQKANSGSQSDSPDVSHISSASESPDETSLNESLPLDEKRS